MPNNGRKLKVFIYHLDNDRELVNVLRSQLEMEGVETVLSGRVNFDAFSAGNADEAGQVPAGNDPIRRLLAGVDVVMFCLSEWFDDVADLESAEWRTILAAALQKRQGELFIIPTCLEPCGVPAALHRWQPVKLYEDNGYQDLMLSLQVRAERLGLELTPHSDWRENLFSMETETVAAQADGPPRSFGALFIWLVLALLLFGGAATVLRVRARNQNNVAQTAQAVNFLMGTATQNVAAQGTERAGTVTALAATFDESYLQTQVFITGVAQTATAVMQQTRIPPTYTATVLAPPTMIVDPRFNLMVLIPGGQFRMGDETDDDASPAHDIDLRDFYMDQYEVSNARYQECVTAGVCLPPNSPASQTRPNYFTSAEFMNYPVINVDWSMANAYCEWRGARLPTEAEWEKAARGTEAFIHPWGDERDCIFANHNACLGDTAAVDKYELGVSVYGLFNMSGNVAEWTSSLLLPYPYDPEDGREENVSSRPHVLRGGSWASPPTDILTYHRVGVSANKISNEIGFRCVRDILTP